MKEILFRGKVIEKDAWLVSSCIKVYGCGEEVELMYCDEDTSETWYYVEPASVGQYVGIRDGSGKPIFEGDIFKDRWNEVYVVKKLNAAFYLCRKGAYGCYNKIASWEIVKNKSAIGNEFDNPELLEVN